MAWPFYKTVYVRKRDALKGEKDVLNHQIVNLIADKNNLHKNLDDKDNEIEHLIMEVNALKALHVESVQETNDMTLKNMRTEQLLYEKR